MVAVEDLEHVGHAPNSLVELRRLVVGLPRLFLRCLGGICNASNVASADRGYGRGGVIRLKRIYNFLCSMLVLSPFA
jgi:hypothetical protein